MITTADRPNRSPSRRTVPHKRLLALAAGGVVALTGLICVAQQQQQGQDQRGQARIVERRGPEVEVQANGQGGQVVVLFPQATGAPQGSPGATGVVEVVLVESQMPAAAADGQQQPQQQQPQSTGREIMFSSRDAMDGLVRHALDQAGNGRRLMVLARVDGQYVDARQTGGGEGITVLTVPQPQRPAQTAQNNAGAAEGQQPQQPDQQQQQQQNQTPAPAAIVIIYAGAGNAAAS